MHDYRVFVETIRSSLLNLSKGIKLAWAESDSFVKKRVAIALLLVLFTALAAGMAPIALKYAVDGLTAENGTATDQGISIESDEFSILPETLNPTIFLLIYILGLWLSRSLGEARWYVYGTADQRLQRSLSRRLFDHVLKLPMPFHLDRKTGALNQTLAHGLAGYSILFNHLVFSVLPVLIEITIIGVVISLTFQPIFLLLLLCTVIAYFCAFAIGVVGITGPSREVANAQINAYATLTDSILNSETIKYFTAEKFVNDQYDLLLQKSEKNWAAFYLRKSMNGLLIVSIFAVSLGTALAIGAHQVSAGQISVGDFVMVNAYMLQIVRPMETLGSAFKSIAQGVAFIEKMMLIINQKTESYSSNPNIVAEIDPRNKGELIFNKVCFAYTADRPIIRSVSYRLLSGQTVAIVGSSGAGKSSIVRLLLRLYELDRGAILLNGRSTHTIPLAELRRLIAVVPQDTVLFNDTIAYNIAFGRNGSNQADIEKAARLAQIHDKIIAMPDGYETVVGERGLKLSGGEKQRISIARAVIKNPQMFVFDEATSSLDSDTEREILENLILVSKGVTTLIIAHRLTTVTHADNIIVLDNGRIVEQGNHSELLSKNCVYAGMWFRQQRGKSRERENR